MQKVEGSNPFSRFRDQGRFESDEDFLAELDEHTKPLDADA
jgi:hypothetical protein